MGKTRAVPTTIELEGMLRAASLHVTRPRVAVLATVHEHPHVDAEFILAAVREQFGGVSRQGVYDVLHALSSAGLVRCIEPAGSPAARYEARVGDNHHHVVCRSCGAVADVDCAVGAAPCLTASDDNGFFVDEAEVVYWGQCPACATNSVPEINQSTARRATARQEKSKGV
jgi:Fur family transcriptional regulator, stress-responsive regulator